MKFLFSLVLYFLNFSTKNSKREKYLRETFLYFIAIEQNERNLFIVEKNNNQKSMEKNIFLPLRVPSAHETYLLQRTSLFLRLITRFSNFSKG